MISIVVIASLMVGVVAGLWIKPARLKFCSTCGMSLGCLACQEVNSGAPRFQEVSVRSLVLY
jgi:hypothetical protein